MSYQRILLLHLSTHPQHIEVVGALPNKVFCGKCHTNKEVFWVYPPISNDSGGSVFIRCRSCIPVSKDISVEYSYLKLTDKNGYSVELGPYVLNKQGQTCLFTSNSNFMDAKEYLEKHGYRIYEQNKRKRKEKKNEKGKEKSKMVPSLFGLYLAGKTNQSKKEEEEPYIMRMSKRRRTEKLAILRYLKKEVWKIEKELCLVDTMSEEDDDTQRDPMSEEDDDTQRDPMSEEDDDTQREPTEKPPKKNSFPIDEVDKIKRELAFGNLTKDERDSMPFEEYEKQYEPYVVAASRESIMAISFKLAGGNYFHPVIAGVIGKLDMIKAEYKVRKEAFNKEKAESVD